MTRIYFAIISLLLIFQSCSNAPDTENRELKLWYNEPAEQWVEALPLGNGRLGAMVFGGVGVERIQLNEESVWTGGPIERANPEALEYLDEIRQLLFDGEYAKGDRLAQEKIMGTRIDGGKHTYQTLGDLFIEFEGLEDVSNYKRSLDLNSAVAKTEFDAEGVTYSREVFASAPDEVIVVKLSASENGKLNFSARMNRPGEAEKVSVDGGRIVMTGFAEYEGRGTRFASVVAVDAKNGEVNSSGDTLSVSNADEAVIRISGRTNHW